MNKVLTNSFRLKNAMLYGTLHDVLVQDGKIAAIRPSGALEIPQDLKSLPVIDAQKQVLFPSFIDVHTHMREPGYEYKEDVASGLTAAAHGGFGGVFAMANTKPVNDSPTVTRYMLEKAEKQHPHGPVLYPVGAVSIGLDGKELAPFGELVEAGCAAFSNDGKPVQSTELFRRAIEYAADFGKVVIDHCEDATLAPGSQMNEGQLSGLLGLKGQPTVGEAAQVARDILLAEYLDLPVHVAHISCRQSLEVIAWAKSRGIKITAETCPHYLFLDESAVENYNTNAKVSPPLRSKSDVEAMREAVRSGVIDMLVTDHAPHAEHEKNVPFDEAPCGFIGLETAVALTYELVRNKSLTERSFVDRWLNAPARVFGIKRINTFTEGDPADFFLFDPAKKWIVSPSTIHSKSLNTPFLNKELVGKVEAHWLNGYQVV